MTLGEILKLVEDFETATKDLESIESQDFAYADHISRLELIKANIKQQLCYAIASIIGDKERAEAKLQ